VDYHFIEACWLLIRSDIIVRYQSFPVMFTRPAHSRPKPNDQGQGHSTKAKASFNQDQRY